ncbi:MAG: hypothetical protein P8Y54_14930 [Xanthomonadales bacterium]
MIEQQGRVTGAAGSQVRVRLGGTSGCTTCDAGRGCGAGVFGRLLQRRPVELELLTHPAVLECVAQAGIELVTFGVHG